MFVLSDDDKVEYAKLNHDIHGSDPITSATTCLTTPEANVIGTLIAAIATCIYR